MPPERRGFRFSLKASAEVAPEGAPNATVAARATELSLHGCFVETPAPFDMETLVLVKIFHAGEYFEAKGSVIYVKPKAGMGLTFREVNPHCQSVLQKWVLTALHKPADAEEG